MLLRDAVLYKLGRREYGVAYLFRGSSEIAIPLSTSIGEKKLLRPLHIAGPVRVLFVAALYSRPSSRGMMEVMLDDGKMTVACQLEAAETTLYFEAGNALLLGYKVASRGMYPEKVLNPMCWQAPEVQQHVKRPPRYSLPVGVGKLGEAVTLNNVRRIEDRSVWLGAGRLRHRGGVA